MLEEAVAATGRKKKLIGRGIVSREEVIGAGSRRILWKGRE